MLRKRFEVYRPPVSSGRLEGEHFRNQAVWAPTVSYKLSLEDIREQLTPAEAYRHVLATSGKEIRILRRLEWKWERNYHQWTRAATIVQAGYRGMIDRQFVALIRDDLTTRKEQREALANAKALFVEDKKTEALHAIETLLEKGITKNEEILILEAKINYIQNDFLKCEEIAKVCVGRFLRCIVISVIFRLMCFYFNSAMNIRNQDGHYLIACAYAARENYLEAYMQLQLVIATVEEPNENVYKLKGFLCSKISPPNYVEGLETFDALVQQYPEDMNSVRQ